MSQFCVYIVQSIKHCRLTFEEFVQTKPSVGSGPYCV